MIDGGQLITYQAKQFIQHWSDKKPERIAEYLERQLGTSTAMRLALVLPAGSDVTIRIEAVLNCVISYCRERGIPLATYERENIYSLWSNNGRAKRKILMHKLVERFPELNYCYERELRNEQPYYIKLFEAVAAAMLLERDGVPPATITS